MKTMVITGATSGIGFAVAEGCLSAGFRVLGIGRNPERIASALNLLREHHPGAEVEFFQADLSEQDETERVAQEIGAFLDSQCGGELFGLVNNAGCVRSWHTTNRKGYETQFALNHLASFVLTSRLLPRLLRGKGRVLFTSSHSHFGMKVRWKDVMFERVYHPLLAYKQSKLCNLLFALSLNRRYGDLGIRAYGIDPGLVKTEIGGKDTGSLVRFVWNLRKRGGRDPKIPARTYLAVLTADPAPEGFYFRDSRPVRYSREVREDSAERLFELSERLTGFRFGDGR